MSWTQETQSVDDWDEVSYIISSQYRVIVLAQLADGPSTPSRLASDSDNAISHISRALGQLRRRSLVELLVSEQQRKGRVYGITEDGEKLWDVIDSKGLA
ncbi:MULTISPECIES: winged helix-turn-helix domain-containing protein [unclassified Haladaptatus]|jgi:DNA-binding MarR family transcriptional regulator|uniref:winged helix-turn-helix domain-containing protein n=1 Tax=unclassified Haladaptatus TaxID=2622732 RepID=UPI002FCE456E